MGKEDKNKIKQLDDMIEEYVKSGKPLSKFMREHIFKEYGENGDSRLHDMSVDYFLERMEDENEKW